jgi:type IV pilus assembly protein PilM
MASARFAWGIDVGNRALKAVKLVREGDGFRIDDFEFIEHETFLSQAGDNRDSLVQAALASFMQKHPQKGGVAAISVSGQQSFARFIKLPPVETKKLPEIVRFEAIQQIPFPLDDVEWAYQLFQTPDSPDVEVGIFAMRKELINRHVGFYTDVDLNVQVVQMSPLAVYNAMAHDGRIDGTTMIIDLGAENTDLIIAEGETVWLRSIPIGGNSFTEALSKAFKVTFQKAEEMKRTAGTSKYVRQIMQAMRPVFADLVAEIQRSVGFYASVHRDSRIKKIVALGGTFKLPGLQKYLQQNLQLDVERIDTINAAPPADAKLAASFNDHLLSSIAAYGLALQAMGDAKIVSSLLPESIRREKLWKDKVKWFAAAAALFALGTGVAYGSWYMAKAQYDSKQDVRNGIHADVQRAQDLDNQWSTIQGSGGTDLSIVKNVHSLTDGRYLWPTLLNEIQNCLPMPQPEVLSGDPDTIKKIERNKRHVIRMETLTSKYIPDLTPILTDPNPENFKRYATEGAPGVTAYVPGGNISIVPSGDPGAPDAAPPPAADAGAAGKAGFLIAIRGTTPYQNGFQLVEQEFVKNLAALNKGATRQYYVDHAVLVTANQIKNDAARLGMLQKQYQDLVHARQGPTAGYASGGGAVGVAGGGLENPGSVNDVGAPQPVYNAPAAVDPNADQAMYQDRITSEDVRDDWGFTVLFAVILGPPTEAVPGAAPAAPGVPAAPAPAPGAPPSFGPTPGAPGVPSH